MIFDDIIKSIKAKDYKPVYFLHGEESFYIDAISNYIEKNVLSEAEKSFNQTILYGKDTDAKTLIDTASRYPMMASHQVVILKEAQEMKELLDLQLYIEKAVPTTILVICYKHGKLDSRTKFAKSLKAHAVIFESKKLYDNQVPDWIAGYVKGKKLAIKPNASQLIAEYLGTDLSKIANELDKLAINLPEGVAIDEKHIQDNIGISKDYNVFELQKALGGRDVVKANRIVRYFAANPRKNPMVVITGSLYNHFSKVYIYHFLRNLPDKKISEALQLKSEFFLKDYKRTAHHYNLKNTQNVISILKEYDLKSKGVDSDNAPEGELMKEMVYKILH